MSMLAWALRVLDFFGKKNKRLSFGNNTEQKKQH
jgi:hypothetical protein